MNSKIVKITDTYDYDPTGDRNSNEDTGVQGFAYDIMYQAQLLGVIRPVKIEITIDISEYLRIQIVNKIGSAWIIKVTNYKNYAMPVFYNSKMCFEYNAANWVDLLDLRTVGVAPNGGSIIVDIQENYLATHFAFSYYSAGKRTITYANETWLADSQHLNPDIAIINYNYYDNIGIAGKNGGTWLINVTNTYNERRKFEYNTKMCFIDNAKNWIGLNDVASFYLEPGESRDIEINENFFATHIAISFVSDTQRNIRYATMLSVSGTMSVSSNTIYIYKYLSLSNSGKSGSTWKINIKNPTSSPITVYYNTKMCNEGDAKNWTGLNNVTSIPLDAGQTKEVLISTNFLATSIAISYFSNGRRLISYANGLNTGGGINVMTNYI